MNKSLSQRGAALGGVVATLTASIALGAAGSVAVYRMVAGPSVTTPALALPSAEETQEAAPAQAVEVKPKVKWAPCKPPAVLEKGVCVTDVVKTVVVPPVASAPAAGAPAARSSGRARAASGNDDRRDRGDDRGRGDDRDDDRDDEDHEDEDHEEDD
ncbi:MAG: hypothetical protein NTX33_18235 [Propionibacteriales bacterium]|nr:hypothetical protein [Propionibacteriales bacterium]